MMASRLAIAAIAAAASVACATTEGAVDPDNVRSYYEQSVRAMLGLDRQEPKQRPDPRSIDYRRFRLGRRFAVAARAQDEIARPWASLTEARVAGNDVVALQFAGEVLELDFADVEAHLVRARALHDAGRGPDAAFHEAIADGLLQSILDGGDTTGSVPSFPVLGPREQQAVLGVMDLTPIDRQTGDQGGRHIETVRCRSRGGREVTVHFDVTPPEVAKPRPGPS
jgi:hypothetical protein